MRVGSAPAMRSAVGEDGDRLALMPAESGVGVGLTGEDPPPHALKWAARTRASTIATGGANVRESPERGGAVPCNGNESYCPTPILAMPGVGVGEGGTGQFRPNPPVAVKSAA